MLFLAKLKTWLRNELLSLVASILVSLIFLSLLILQPPFIIYSCYQSKGWILVWLAYFLWIEYDVKNIKTGSRWIKGSRNWIIFKYSGEYFPLRLIKVADLTPDRNYVMACFPHAIMPFGAGLNLLTNTTKGDELFPGVDIRGTALPFTLRFPLIREFFIAIGVILSDKESLLYLLNATPSTAILLFPGGVREIFHSHPGNVYTIIKKNRKGFIKIALESGSPLVPIFSFGDQNLHDLVEFKSPVVIYLSELLHKFMRIKLLLLRGRKIFGWDLGIIVPKRRPVTTVVGRPIEVPKVENPSDELVDEYHEKFFKALYDLFEEYKAECDEAGEAAQLITV